MVGSAGQTHRENERRDETLAGALAREVYDVPHPAPWGWKIAAYLWTKAVAAGVLLVAAILLSFGGQASTLLFNVLCPALALAGLTATSALLIFDLKRPDRFFYLITQPNFRSWLVIGTGLPDWIRRSWNYMAAVRNLSRLGIQRGAMVRRGLRDCERMLLGISFCPGKRP